MTPTEAMALIGLWRAEMKTGPVVYADDVAIEISTTADKTFGRVRAENCLRKLQDKKLVKKGTYDNTYTLSAAGKKLCAALKQMGLGDQWSF